MSFSTVTSAEQVENEVEVSKLPKSDFSSPRPINTDSTLPTHHLPLCDHGLPPALSPAIPSSINNTLTVSGETIAWFSHVKEYAPVVGVVGTIIGVVVAIITVVVK